VRRLAGAILGAQHRHVEQLDWIGGYYEPPRGTPTACRSEGLAAALDLALRRGDPALAEAIFEGLLLGVRFQLQLQLGPDSALYLPDPARCQGGFRRSLVDHEIRIDYVQHNLSSLLGVARHLSDAAAPPTVGESRRNA
jgi:hypothetical protein